MEATRSCLLSERERDEKRKMRLKKFSIQDEGKRKIKYSFNPRPSIAFFSTDSDQMGYEH